MKTSPSPDKTPCLFFLPDLNGGGAERAALNLIRSWSESPQATQYEPVLVLRRMAGAYMDEIPPGVRTIVLGSKSRSGLLASLTTVWRLSSLIRKERPAVLTTFLSHPSAVLGKVLSRWNCPVLASIQNPVRISVSDLHSSWGHRWLGKLKMWGTGLSYKKTDGFLVISRGIGQELVEDFGANPSRVWLLPNSVELTGLSVTPDIPGDLADIKKTPSGKHVLLAAGRLVQQKGFDLLLQAFAKLSERHPDWSLVILGEGQERPLLMEQAKTLGIAHRVHLLGFQKTPANYFAHTDLFVLSSRYEGFGNVIIEAMACGAPIVSTDAPYGPVDILAGGRYGRLCAPNSLDALEQGLNDLMGDNAARSRLKQLALERSRDYERTAVFAQFWSILSSRILNSDTGLTSR